jgi:hypothetical protein
MNNNTPLLATPVAALSTILIAVILPLNNPLIEILDLFIYLLEDVREGE